MLPAGRLYFVNFEDINVGTARSTLAQVNGAAAFGFYLHSFGIGLGGTSPSADPVEIDIARVTTAGTGTSYTPRRPNKRDAAASVTATIDHSAEGTLDEVVMSWPKTHPQGGIQVMDLQPFGIYVPDDGRIALRILAAAEPTASGFLAFIEP